MKFIYNISIFLTDILIRVASLFNSKAGLFVSGRQNWVQSLKENLPKGKELIWVHCASLGEFEQGRPVIEKLKERNNEIKIILTFFSPSGYEIRKDYKFADYICYLPFDTPWNARRFVSLVHPSKVIFIKYEFWYNYISEIHNKGIPLYLVSGIFRPDQHFFKWYGGFFRKMLKKFSHFFVQDRKSFDLLESIGLSNLTITGDTRFDRVSQIARESKKIEVIERFAGNEKVFLAGSSWKEDEEIITAYINSDPKRMKWIFAPHEIDKPNIDRLEKLIKTSVVRYSAFSDESVNARVLIIDNIGLLASAYRYCHIAAVGGGFGKGIHSILEPACWGVPVLFGPDHKGFREAGDLIERGGSFCFRNNEEFDGQVNKLLDNPEYYKKTAGETALYVGENTGATEKILEYLR
jgi:3-deoxy-D-manno-octulosonic-acid transferase